MKNLFSFTHSSLYSCPKYLLSTYFVLGTQREKKEKVGAPTDLVC